MSEMTFYNIVIGIWVVSAALTAPTLLFIVAPYGRHVRGGWGPKINDTLGWIIMEAPSPLLMIILFFIGDRTGNPVAQVFLAMWLLHYINRAFIYPMRRKAAGKQMPMMIMFSAIFFNMGNGYINGRYLFGIGPDYTTDWFTDPRFIIGLIIFLSGWAINFHSDEILRNLRKPGETGYKIPQGGFYRWLSCPNYFGEMVEWIGWAIATWSLPGVVFAFWTASNLAPRARSNHKWYLEKFEDYPKERKALIPFVY